MDEELNLSKYKWQLLEKSLENNEDLIDHLQQAGLNYSPAFLRVCLARGLDSVEKIQAATNQEPVLFHDPYLLYQMEKAINRIKKAVEDDESILIYGDYDADGITSTLILLEALQSIGARVDYYLPNRFTDGYGPNIERYQETIAAGTQLIITVDNGVAGHEAIEVSQELGVDVIVTDHHELQATLPPAYAVIHPKHPKGNYPFGELSGAGVALKVAAALLGEIPGEALELAAIGTVADMVSLTDENKTIVVNGLKSMQFTQRIGLELLLQENSVNMSQLTTETIGFVIGPRLNAIGRLGDPSPALELLSELDIDEAGRHLQFINGENSRRQTIVKEILSAVDKKIKSYQELPLIIIEEDEKWHPGVLGIVASRIKDKYQRPTLLFHYDEEKEAYIGSGRSLSTINLFEWLSNHSDLMLYFGGHSQAAGLTVEKSNWSDFKDALHTSSENYRSLIEAKTTLPVDLVLTTAEISLDLINEIALLGPFGMDNSQPVIAVGEALIQEKRVMGTNQEHVKLIVNSPSSQTNLTTVGFSLAERLSEFKTGDRIWIAGKLSLNEWRGKKTAQLMMEDIGVRGCQWIDVRSSRIPDQLAELSETIYLFSNKTNCELYQKQLHSDSRAVIYEELSLEEAKTFLYNNLVIMEPPNQINDFIKIYHHNEAQWEKVYLGSFVHESKYLAGEPTRQEFVLLYQWVQKLKIIPLNKLPEIAQQLDIALVKIKTMIVVFFEAGFVKIEDGTILYQTLEQGDKVDLLELPALKNYRQSMKAEELFNYQTVDEIRKYINKESS